MHGYAQINIQLYDQMRCREYSPDDIAAVHDAYELARQLTSGRFRPSGKPLQDHLVGTASILAERRAPLKFLRTAILHAVYDEGDFGTFATFSLQARRRRLQSVLDPASDDLLTAYAGFAWNTHSILRAAETFDRLSEIERDVIFLRLANDLEDNLDLAVLYCPNREARLRYLKQCGPAMVQLAMLLDQRSLAAELEHAHAALQREETDGRFPVATTHTGHWLSPPQSYRKRVVHAVAPPLLHNARRVARKLRRLSGAKKS